MNNFLKEKVERNEFHQCAWCHDLILNGIRIERSDTIILNPSHGICQICKEELEKSIVNIKKSPEL